MTTEEKFLHKTCCFYASDFHLEMTLLPYINKKIEENKDVIIVTQNSLRKSVEILISKIHIINKEQILNLDWDNNKIDKIEKNKNLIVIVNGTEQFIKEINNKIEEKENIYPIEIVNCYLFDEIKDKIDVIRDSYERVLNNLQKNY